MPLIPLNKICAAHDLPPLYKEISVCTKSGKSLSLLEFISGQLLTCALIRVWLHAVVATPVGVIKGSICYKIIWEAGEAGSSDAPRSNS